MVGGRTRAGGGAGGDHGSENRATREPCPAIEDGDEQTTRVVTATFKYHGGQPWELKLEGNPEPIGVTAWHMVWRTDLEDWAPVASLQPGARVRLLTGGEGVVESVTERTEIEPVYNLEVDADHIYRVTDAGVLVHNQSGGACPLELVLERRDVDIHSKANALGRPKAYLDSDAGLVSARGSLKGYSGVSASVMDHLYFALNPVVKAHSHPISFSGSNALPQIVSQFGPVAVRLNASRVLQAIKESDNIVAGVMVVSQPQIRRIVRASQFSRRTKRAILSQTIQQDEWFIGPHIPLEFLELV